ncbi:glycosyltransferase family 2 protein [Anaerovibrio lipolyticus]|uniref:glycosyltransferase family 2 protein n=1 Tax=Anaerovibrio lipolyticus TaxID=82374 RepID=UPI0026F345D7|nr:glycosyltransferase family 2 protein [Anaerovibrio lipolyticus]
MKIKDFSQLNLFKPENCFEEFQDVKSILKHGTRMSEPELSIMIVAYKRTDFIQEAIMSALNQITEHRYEVVVVDNSDGDSAVYELVSQIDDPRLSYYMNERNIGTSGNMNRCAELAGGNYFTILCDDDVLLPIFVEEMLNKIALAPDCAAIGSRFNFIDEKGNITYEGYNRGDFYQAKSIFRWLLGYQFVLVGSVFSKKHFLESGGLDRRAEPGPDAVLCLRLNITKKCYIYNKVLSQYRVWGKMGSAIPEIGYEAASFVKKYTSVLGNFLHLDGYFIELNTRQLVIDYEKLSKENFKAGCDWEKFNNSIGIKPLTDAEKKVYNQMKNFYMQREAIGADGEVLFVGDMALKVSEKDINCCL